MSTCLKPRESHLEIANGLLRLLRSKGFSTHFTQRTLCARSLSGASAKRILIDDISKKVLELIDKHGLWRAVDLERAGQLTLPINIRERRFIPCAVIERVDSGEREDIISREEIVSIETVHDITICSACLFVREGYSSTRRLEFLDDLRVIVAQVLSDFGYSLDERRIDTIPVLPHWTECRGWKCLAIKEGAVRHVPRSEEGMRQPQLAITSW